MIGRKTLIEANLSTTTAFMVVPVYITICYNICLFFKNYFSIDIFILLFDITIITIFRPVLLTRLFSQLLIYKSSIKFRK